MMDGCSRVLGCGCGFMLGGSTWLVGPLRMRHYGEMEHRILFDRKTNPLREMSRVMGPLEDIAPEAAGKLARDVASDLRKNQAERMVKIDELVGWINGPGLTYSAWCCLRECGNPDFVTLEGVSRFLLALPVDEIREFVRLRDQISGIDLIANGDWEDPMAGVRESKRADRLRSLRKLNTPWRVNVYTLGQNNGFSDEVIGNWTLYQVRVYTASEDELGIERNGSTGTISAGG